MPRNLFERCEVVFPIRDTAAKSRIHDEILPALLADTLKARLQQSDGTYIRANKFQKDAPPFSCQDFLMQLAEGKADIDSLPKGAVHAVDASGPRRRLTHKSDSAHTEGAPARTGVSSDVFVAGVVGDQRPR